MVLATYSSSPSCVSNLKLLASMVAEINRGSHFFGCSPNPRPPPILVLKVIFVKLLCKPKLYTKLKLDSTVAEISRGPKIFGGTPLAQTPARFSPKIYFANLLFKPNLYTKFYVPGLNDCRNKYKCTVNNTRSILSSRDFRLCAACATALGLLAAGLPF